MQDVYCPNSEKLNKIIPSSMYKCKIKWFARYVVTEVGQINVIYPCLYLILSVSFIVDDILFTLLYQSWNRPLKFFNDRGWFKTQWILKSFKHFHLLQIFCHWRKNKTKQYTVVKFTTNLTARMCIGCDRRRRVWGRSADREEEECSSGETCDCWSCRVWLCCVWWWWWEEELCPLCSNGDDSVCWPLQEEYRLSSEEFISFTRASKSTSSSER